MRTLMNNSLGTFEMDDEEGILVVTRKETALDLDVIESIQRELEVLLPISRRKELGLIFDMRQAPLSRPETEAQLFAFAGRMLAQFRCAATVLKTAVGRLQAARIRRDNLIPDSAIVATLEEARAHVIAILHGR